MNLIRISDQKYPYTIDELKRDNPTISFPKDLTGIDLSEFNAAEVFTDPVPVGYNYEAEIPEPELPVLEEGIWKVKWTIRSLSLIEISQRKPIDWSGFNNDILQDVSFNEYYGTVFQAAPVVAASIPAAFTQVANVGFESFAIVYSLFCQIAVVQQEDKDNWAQLAQNRNLPGDFIDLIRGSV